MSRNHCAVIEVAGTLLATLLLGFAAAVAKRRRSNNVYGRGIAPRTSRHIQRRRLLVCTAVTKMKERMKIQQRKMRMKAVPNRVRKCWVRPIFLDHEWYGAWFTLVPTLRATDPERFYNYFRMTVKCFDRLLVKVAPYMSKKSWRQSVCPGERLAITLRYLASGNYQISLSYEYRVSEQCISTIVYETTSIIWNVLKDEVLSIPNEETWLKSAAEFEVMWNVPHVIGAIDGKHVAVQAFPHCGSRYHNYKGFHSMILMAVCDAKERFLLVDFGGSGRRGDGNVFHFSTLGEMFRQDQLQIPPPCPVDGLQNDLPFVFVADNAFFDHENMITPFKGTFLPPEEVLFNYRLSRARRVIENAFGILVARFRILRRTIIGSKALVQSIVLSCVALHNLHLQERRKYRPPGYADCMKPDGTYNYGRWRQEKPAQEKSIFQKLKRRVFVAPKKHSKLDGEEVVLRFLKYFVDNPVSWQWRKMHIL